MKIVLIIHVDIYIYITYFETATLIFRSKYSYILLDNISVYLISKSFFSKTTIYH